MFPKILTLILLVIVTLNIIKYFCKFLHLYELVQLYKKLLNQLNITYMITEIKKPKFEKLNFLVFFSIGT